MEKTKLEQVISFDAGSYEITPAARTILEDIAHFLAAPEQREINRFELKVSHEDAGSKVADDNLSINRATAAKKILKQNLERFRRKGIDFKITLCEEGQNTAAVKTSVEFYMGHVDYTGVGTQNDRLNNVRFKCTQIINKRLTVENVLVRSCYLYLFYKQHDTYHYQSTIQGFEMPLRPAEIDEYGFCNYPFERGATYYAYFSGKILSELEVVNLKDRDNYLLIRIIPTSDEVIINQSFFWWICLLQHIENVITDPLDVLTKVRKLYFDDDNWDRLINRGDIEPLISWNRDDGSFTVNHEIDLEIIFSIGRRYELTPDNRNRFEVEDGQRRMIDRHEYVIMPDGNQIAIGHVLTGMETYLFEPTLVGDIFVFEYPHSAATWAGDLGQAAFEAIRIFEDNENAADDDGYYTDVWCNARENKAPLIEMVADIYGIVLGRERAQNLRNHEVKLSKVLELYFYCYDIYASAVDSFLSEYTLSLEDLENCESGEPQVLREEIEDFAEIWDHPAGDIFADFDEDDDDHRQFITMALDYLKDLLFSLSQITTGENVWEVLNE